jgi:Mg-chelatase subunit ChlI
MKISSNLVFPFGAIVGQDRVKLGLLLGAINPSIGGVLIIGDRGTGKSTAVKALRDLIGALESKSGVAIGGAGECSLGCTTSDIEGLDGEPLRQGPPLVEINPSITETELKNRLRPFTGHGILFIKGVERLGVQTAEAITDTAATDWYSQGRALSLPPRFIMIAASDSVPPASLRKFCEGFGLCVMTERIEDPDERLRVLQYREDFDRDPEGFLKKFEPDQDLIRERIRRAAEILHRVVVPENLVRHIADFGLSSGMRGHDADIATLRTARTIAAFDARDEVREDDVRAAIELSMPHRMWDEILGKCVAPGAAGEKLQLQWTSSGRDGSRFKSPVLEPREEQRKPRRKPVQSIKQAKECVPQAASDESSRLLIFVADMSGQYATTRAGAVKEAVPELIEALPGPLDRLALITVRGQSATLALAPARDKSAAIKKCRQLQSGGKTPLPDALEKALSLARDEIRKDPSVHPLLAILSDGRANVSKGKNVMLDVEESAAAIAKNGFPTLVIDPEGMGTRVGMATSLAQKMRATYHAMEAPNAVEIVETVKEHLLC